MLEILEKVHYQFVMRTVKNQIDNEFQLDTLKLLIETLGVRIIVSDDCDFMAGIIKLLLRATGSTAKPPQKKSACDVIKVLGDNLRIAAEHVVPIYQADIMKALDQVATEKQLDVQSSRKEAIEVWKELGEISKQIQ